MKVTYDPKADAMNIRFQRGKYSISKEVINGIVIDYTRNGKVLSIEILDVSKRIPLRNIKNLTVRVPTKAA